MLVSLLFLPYEHLAMLNDEFVQSFHICKKEIKCIKTFVKENSVSLHVFPRKHLVESSPRIL